MGEYDSSNGPSTWDSIFGACGGIAGGLLSGGGIGGALAGGLGALFTGPPKGDLGGLAAEASVPAPWPDVFAPQTTLAEDGAGQDTDADRAEKERLAQQARLTNAIKSGDVVKVRELARQVYASENDLSPDADQKAFHAHLKASTQFIDGAVEQAYGNLKKPSRK